MEPSMGICGGNVFENNEGAIKLAVNEHYSCKTEHIVVEHHVMIDSCDARKVRVVYVRTKDQHEDLFTKPLDVQKFYKQANTVLGVV